MCLCKIVDICYWKIYCYTQNSVAKYFLFYFPYLFFLPISSFQKNINQKAKSEVIQSQHDEWRDCGQKYKKARWSENEVQHALLILVLQLFLAFDIFLKLYFKLGLLEGVALSSSHKVYLFISLFHEATAYEEFVACATSIKVATACLY